MYKHEDNQDFNVMACCRRNCVSVNEAIALLSSNELETISVPPSKPKSGEVYLFKADDQAKKGKL